MKRKTAIKWISALISALMLALPASAEESEKSYIKWIDFDVTARAMEDAARADTDSYGTEQHIDWITLLSLLGAKYGGDFSH